jgi:beta-lactamase class A
VQHLGYVVLAMLVSGSGPRASAAGDAALISAIRGALPGIVLADRAAAGGHGSADAIQAQYDTARDLQEAINAAGPITAGCLRLRYEAEKLVSAEIRQAEGFDRHSARLVAQGVRAASAQLTRLAGARLSCGGGRPSSPQRLTELLTPRDGEPFTGPVLAAVPSGAQSAQLLVDGRLHSQVRAAGHRVLRFTVRSPRGPHDIEVRFFRRGKLVGRAGENNAWLVPPTAAVAALPLHESRDLDAKLATLARAYAGKTAIWIENLESGTYASWNADARFPAASLVKLGLLTAALRTFGPRPERSRAAYDLQTLTAWSSNLAANRLLVEVGGVSAVNGELARLGAAASTYPGPYRVGTSARRAGSDAPDPPPLVSQRTTTARDMARILLLIDQSATGNRAARLTTQLTRHEALVGLGLLLDSKPIDDNIGLLRPWLPGSFPIAQKNGWLHDARHTAAIVYSEDGPRLIVILTYKVGQRRTEAAAFGRRVLETALQH